jgi:hypothetical protein
MKSVNEIKEMKSDWIGANDCELGILGVFDTLIGITEHLTAQQLAIPRAFGPLINPDDERRGMIEALRWVISMCILTHGQKVLITDAVTRLEKGGEL